MLWGERTRLSHLRPCKRSWKRAQDCAFRQEGCWRCQLLYVAEKEWLPLRLSSPLHELQPLERETRHLCSQDRRRRCAPQDFGSGTRESEQQSKFRRWFQLSFLRIVAKITALPPVLLVRLLPHLLQPTSFVEAENTTLSSPQSGHSVKR